MNITQDQISELLLDLANKENGTQLLMKMTLEAFMLSERSLHQKNMDDYSNGYRPRKIKGFGKEMVLKVPRTRSGVFYPALLQVLRDEDEEHRKLIFSLYSKGLTTEQVSDIYEELYGKSYSKQQISYLMKDSRDEIHLWLKRSLESHYLVLYIDAIFVHTRRDQSVSKEGYYNILGVKEDGTREVLAIVNHPTEGALSWEVELDNLKLRGVKSVGLIVSDGLSGIENSIAKSFPMAKHQLCVVHAKRNILNIFPRKLRAEISAELRDVFEIETDKSSQIEGFEKLCNFVTKWSERYPKLKSFSAYRNAAYFTYLELPSSIQRMVYSTNWVERLHKDHRRVLKMRGSLPNADAVIALMGAVAMEKENKTYKYSVYTFIGVTELMQSSSI